MTPEHTRLTAALRELKERTGLSLAALAARTTFSKSSWERYLNGRTLPPREAVQELCGLADEPSTRCLALREMAGAEWNAPVRETPVREAPAVPPPAAPAPVTHRGTTAAVLLASVSAVVFGAVVLTLLLLPDHGEPPRTATAGPHCQGRSCEGKDPVAMACGGAPETLVEHVAATGASMQVRYSKACGASWIRMWGSRIGDRVELQGQVAQVANRAEADTYVYTPMATTGVDTVVRACFMPRAGGRHECFRAKVY